MGIHYESTEGDNLPFLELHIWFDVCFFVKFINEYVSVSFS